MASLIDQSYSEPSCWCSFTASLAQYSMVLHLCSGARDRFRYYFTRGAAETAFVGVKCRDLACSLNSQTFCSFMEFSSTWLSLFADSERTGFRYHFPTRHGRNIIKQQLISLKIPQCPAIQREHLGLVLSSSILGNVVLQYPRLFHRRHCLGQ